MDKFEDIVVYSLSNKDYLEKEFYLRLSANQP